MKNKYQKGLSANILLLGIVSFLNDLSSEMILPILPLFITALGGTTLIVGIIGGLQESISSILKVLSGFLSDRTGKRKIFVASGYLTSAVFKLLLALSRLWQHILIFICFERVGKGLRTAPRDAIIADSMPEARGKGFGIHRALDTAGAIAGSIVVLLLLIFLWSELEQNTDQIAFYKSTIFIAAIIAFLSLIPLYLVKEGKSEPQAIILQISLKKLPEALKVFIGVATVFALANFTYMFFILKTMDAFTPLMPVKQSIAIVITLYIIFNIFYAVFAIPFGTLSDRIGRRKVLIAGYLLFSFTCLGFAFADSVAVFLVLFMLYGLVYAIIDGNQRAFVSDLSTADLRATALGTYHTLVGIVALPASVIAGLLGTITPSWTFLFGSSVSFISVILFIALRSHFEKKTQTF